MKKTISLLFSCFLTLSNIFAAEKTHSTEDFYDFSVQTFHAWHSSMSQCPTGECPLYYHLDGLTKAYEVVNATGDEMEAIKNAANEALKHAKSFDELREAWIESIKSNFAQSK